MRQVVYEHPIDGKQHYFEMGPGSALSDDCVIVWDSDTDGPLDKAMLSDLGALKKNGKDLEVDSHLKAVKEDEEKLKTDAKQALITASEYLQSLDISAIKDPVLAALVTLTRG